MFRELLRKSNEYLWKNASANLYVPKNKDKLTQSLYQENRAGYTLPAQKILPF